MRQLGGWRGKEWSGRRVGNTDPLMSEMPGVVTVAPRYPDPRPHAPVTWPGAPRGARGTGPGPPPASGGGEGDGGEGVG